MISSIKNFKMARNEDIVNVYGETKEEVVNAMSEAGALCTKYSKMATPYASVSMDNICDMFNNGFKDESDYYLLEHIEFCDMSREKAQALGKTASLESNISDIKNAVEDLKNTTLKTIEEFKKLIKEENSTMEKLSNNKGKTQDSPA